MKRCPTCRLQFADEKRYCHKCGGALIEEIENAGSLSLARSSPRKPLWLMGFVAVALLFGFVVYRSLTTGPPESIPVSSNEASSTIDAQTLTPATPTPTEAPVPPPPEVIPTRTDQPLQPKAEVENSSKVENSRIESAANSPSQRSEILTPELPLTPSSEPETKVAETASIVPPPTNPVVVEEPPAAATSVASTADIKNEIFEVKLLSPLSASKNRKGDRFTTQVLRPDRLRNTSIEGEVRNSKASGKVKGTSELSFSFDRLVLPDGTIVTVDAELTSIRNGQGVENVDEEGHVIGKSTRKQDITRTLAGGAIGGLIGGLLGGRKGAAQGSAIGAAVALTIAFSTQGPDIQFAPGSIFLLSVTKTNESKDERKLPR